MTLQEFLSSIVWAAFILWFLGNAVMGMAASAANSNHGTLVCLTNIAAGIGVLLAIKAADSKPR